MKWVWVLALCLGVVAGCGCGDDDDSGNGNDDIGDDDADDDTADDDGDDDAADDDTWPPLPDDDDAAPDPWADLTPSGLPVGEVLGIATQMSGRLDPDWTRQFEIDKLLEAGMKRIRAAVKWDAVEPAQDTWEWEAADAYVDALTSSGLRFDGRLCYGVDWAQPDGMDSSIDPADFADYAGHVAARYCGVVDSWEVWNEENHNRFWDPEPDPAAFGALMKAAYVAVHDACPQAQVVFGGMSCLESDFITDGLYYFLERVWQAHPDIADYFDIMAIHPYTFLQQTMPEWSIGDAVDGLWPSLPGQIELIRKRMDTIGASGKPVWLTEWGWPSLIIGAESQARFFDRGALLAVAEGAESLHWYTFWNKDGTDPLPTEDYFGLFTYPHAEGGPIEKPVFPHVKTMSSVLGTSRYAGDLAAALGLPEEVYALAFAEDGGAVTLAAWCAEFGRVFPLAVPVPEGATHYAILADTGEVIDEGAPGDAVSVTLTQDVVYVRFDE